MNFGLVGYGYWGNILFSALNSCKFPVRFLADRNVDKLSNAKEQYPNIITDNDINSFVLNKNIDAVLIALPASEHFYYAKLCLEHGKHVFIEKPMAMNFDEARYLNKLATDYNLTLMVNHHFIYKDSIQRAKSHLSTTIGKLQYCDSTRTNLGIFRSDVDVILDLAPHDISILLYFAEKLPVAVSAIAYSTISKCTNDISYITLYFENFTAHINVSWVSAFKNRSIIMGGEKGTILFDDTQTEDKLTITPVEYCYNHNRIEFAKKRTIIEKDTSNALANAFDDFVRSIERGAQPLSNGKLGMAVALIIDAIHTSVAKNGAIIKITEHIS